MLTHCLPWMPTDLSPPAAWSRFQAGADKQTKDRTPSIFADIHFSWVAADNSLYRSKYTQSETQRRYSLPLPLLRTFFISGNWMDGGLHVRFLVVKVVCSQKKEWLKLLAPSKDYMKGSLSPFYCSLTWLRSMESHTPHVPIGQQPDHPLTTVFLCSFFISVTHLQHSHSWALLSPAASTSY